MFSQTHAGSGGSGSTASGNAGGGSGGQSSGCPTPYEYVNIFGPGAPQQIVNILCGNVVVQYFVVLANGTPPGPVVTGGTLAQQAFGSFKLPAPAPRMAPAPDKVIVQLPTWLWIDGWQPRTATASVPGLSATVTAVPTKVVWTMGDGGSVTCAGPGKAYDPAVPYEQQTTDCSYTYHRSSAGQPADAYAGSVTVSYGASWTATDGTGGTLGPLGATATFTVRVAEIQGLNT